METTNNAKSLFERGLLFLDDGQTDRAIIAFEEAADMYEKSKDIVGYTRAINGIGVAYAEAGNEAIAIEYYMDGLARARKEKRIGVSHLFYNNIGTLYQELRDYKTSIRYFLMSEDDLIAGGPITVERAEWFIGCYLNLGISYWHIGNYLYSELYLYKARNLADEFDIHSHDFAIEIMFARLYSSIGNSEYVKVKLPHLMEYLDSFGEVNQEYQQDVHELVALLQEIKEYDMMKLVIDRFEVAAGKVDSPQMNLRLQIYKIMYYEAIGDTASMADACVDHAKYYMQVRRKEADENAITLSVKMELGQAEADRKEAIRIAEEDALTGIKNRYALSKQTKDLCVRCAEARVSVVVGIVDVDYFKEYNDTYGHIDGDEVLRKIAKVLMQSTTQDTQIYRYGGDEFLIIAGQSFYNDAVQFAEKIKENLEKLAIVSGAGARYEHVTVTQGYYTLYPQGNDDFKKIVGEADALLYRAKKQGKNCYLIRDKERGEQNDL